MSILDVEFEGDDLVCKVALRGRARCSGCGRKCSCYDTLPRRRWRHLGIGAGRLYLETALRRVDCPKCGVIVEQTTWAAPKARFTYVFEDLVAWLTGRADKTTVSRLLRIAWETVGVIVERVVARHRGEIDFKQLRAISVDELSWRKGHRYITLVVDLDRQRVIWGTEGRTQESLERFFDEIGEDARSQLEYVAIDMSAPYAAAISKKVPKAKIVYDRFHAQQLVSEAVDEVRREEWRNQKGTDEGRAVKSTRYALLKSPWKLQGADWDALHRLQQTNARLYRAYLLKEAFCNIYRYLPSTSWARRQLKGWLAWTSRCRMAAFVKAGRTVRKHLRGILRYFDTGYTTSPSEGLNNKARLATRQAYGFHSAQAALAMIELRCSGIDVPLPWDKPLLC